MLNHLFGKSSGKFLILFCLSFAFGCQSDKSHPQSSPAPTVSASPQSLSDEKSTPSGGGGVSTGTGSGPSGDPGAQSRPAKTPTSKPVIPRGQGGRPAKLEVADGIDISLKDYPGYEDAKMVRKTIAYSSDSVERGKKIYTQSCQICHGADGSGPEERRYNVLKKPRNLAEPFNYRYGASDQAIYRSIYFGIPRSPMGGYEKTFSSSDIWDIVNFIRSIEK